MNQFITSLLTAGLTLLACGCSLGPQALKVSHGQYNEAIRMTRDEQLLLNLVRLRYRDAPTFLEVSSITSQFVIDQTTTVSGEINEGPTIVNPDMLSLGAGLSYSERPTISYVPLAGDKFVGQMLSPLDLETLILLTGSGWSADRVFRLTVQGLNGVENARAASGPTPDVAPPFAEFARISSRYRELQNRGKIEIGIESREATLSESIPGEAITAVDLLAATKDSCRFRRQADDAYVLTRMSKGSILRIASDAVDSPEVRELTELLRLKPGRLQYDLVLAERVLPRPDGLFEAIQIAPRSLLGAMFYLSQSVEVPVLHRRRGLVTITQDAEGNEFDWSRVVGDLMAVRSSLVRPLNASVMVRYKGYYFYIDASDLSSKTTFALLVQLFELQAGREAGASPVLTIPVGD